MILFFEGTPPVYYALAINNIPSLLDINKLVWLFGQASLINTEQIDGIFTGPRREMITPWSTNAVEMTQNMGIRGISRIEEFTRHKNDKPHYDLMLQALYLGLDQHIFDIHHQAEPLMPVYDIRLYNLEHGLALNKDEIDYLDALSHRLQRPLTDCEVFGFSQVNSEHCRHKIFNAAFVIDGVEQKESLFAMIKKTSTLNPNRLVSAYSDNVAFIEGPLVEQFAPKNQHIPDFFSLRPIETVISLKAETHNFPTTVEPFNGAATGSGGEIRDRMAGGKGSMPLAGTAVYMTSYPRFGRNARKTGIEERKWLYHSPLDILIRASNGASDFGNKFGQPLICGSLFTFEHQENNTTYGYDKVVMLAGGIGFARKSDALKDVPTPGDKIIVMGGDNYRIGMGGGAVSSVATGEYGNQIELNAVQRSNPEMQKRVYNVIRALAESEKNPIVSVHDHGAGGHLNSLSELVEHTGGVIDMSKLPVGDPTLSPKELAGNESQERMGLLFHESDINVLNQIAERERAPMYIVGQITGDQQLVFEDPVAGNKPIDLAVVDMFGSTPQTLIQDKTIPVTFEEIDYQTERLLYYIESVLQMESVACKDWLTNKVDRSVTGRVATQQCTGPLQLPLNNLGVMAIDYQGIKGVATSLGHAPAMALIDPAAGSRMAIAKALTNVIWAPIEGGLKGISLSANWMWPSKNIGEDARLYKAVKAASDFAIALGINIPTGKDSLSMTQKYPDGSMVYAPGTVIVSAVGEVQDICSVISPVLNRDILTTLIYIDFSFSNLALGGTAFAQSQNKVGNKCPDVADADAFKIAFETIQQLIILGKIAAGHDISSGGLITTLLEMTFSRNNIGLDIDLSPLAEKDSIKLLFNENPGIVIQVSDYDYVAVHLHDAGVGFQKIGNVLLEPVFCLRMKEENYRFDIHALRQKWFETSYLFDVNQVGINLATKRFENYHRQLLKFCFNKNFTGSIKQYNIDRKVIVSSRPKAAIIREKGVNGDREMAWSLYLAGFDVKDVHMTDLISGREMLDDINMIAFVGGFSNSDVLGSAKGWAGAFLYNEMAKKALDCFYARPDTLSLGVCNGCQLMVELGLVFPEPVKKPRMLHNASNKFESAFLSVDIPENHSVMLSSLAGSRLGIWVAHGEGRFHLPHAESKYHIAAKYSYDDYPGNPNGSKFNTAAVCSDNGRHLAIMPHLERSILPWQWAWYPEDRQNDEVSPWIEAFVNARKWIVGSGSSSSSGSGSGSSSEELEN
ncbi:MAG: phosphoribosylformylglycinamidine synthase [Bacteroidales bacterium]|nr:phosphoribosylformylglycinamidine synthase [Bacteroidales bacterium]MDZ4205088.1 phosphoribosylformylglycinamidine synthase [Bacteroidales bacterium]